MSETNINVIDESNIFNYTTDDKDIIFANGKKNKEGFPLVFPQFNKKGEKVILSFIEADVNDLEGNKLTDKSFSFEVLENESLDENDKDKERKIQYLLALLSPSKFVSGGVYFKGKYFTSKMDSKEAYILLRQFMNSYFHVEDESLIRKYYDEKKDGRLPFIPTKHKDGTRDIFRAIDATITPKGEAESFVNRFNFVIHAGDIFDLEKEDDLRTVNIINNLMEDKMIVKGFYYKGSLLDENLSIDYRKYLAKSFIKKNFIVEQKEYIFSHFFLDRGTNYPLYFPMSDENGRKICITVFDAIGIGVNEKFANFNIYDDEDLDLSNKDVRDKLNIVKLLLQNRNDVNGYLYLDGMLVPGEMSKEEIKRRLHKVQSILHTYLNEDEDFMKISTTYTIEDKENLLNLTDIYDDCYPNSHNKVPQVDTSNSFLRFDRCNLVKTSTGAFYYPDSISGYVNAHENLTKEQTKIVVSAITGRRKVRGGLYFNGYLVNTLNKKDKKFLAFEKEMKEFLKDEDFTLADKKTYFKVNKKNHMPQYWPIKDKNGREVLCSVIDASVKEKKDGRVFNSANHMSFDIYQGETLGLVGVKGSGKSAIARAIVRDVKLNGGAIYFRGKLISEDLSKIDLTVLDKDIQMIFQNHADRVKDKLTLEKILCRGLDELNIFKSKEERNETAQSMLTKTGLQPEQLYRPLFEFDHEQKQVIEIARALVVSPVLVLADEPFANLKEPIRTKVIDLLEKLKHKEGLTYLFLSQNFEDIKKLSDRIAVLNDGYIVEYGTTKQILENPQHPYTQKLLGKDVTVYAEKYEAHVFEQVEEGHYVLKEVK